MNESEVQRDAELSSPVVERAPKQLEVIRNVNTDVVINHDSAEALWAYKVADAWENSAPQDWQKIEESYHELLVGEIDGRKFIAKKRIHGFTSHEDAVISSKESERRHRYAIGFNSVLSELSNAPTIKGVVESGDFQDALRNKYGIKGLSFVEPLVGIVDRHNSDSKFSDKYTVYPFVENTGNLYEGKVREAINLTRAQAQSMIDDVKEAMKDIGMTPGDLNLNQVLLGEDGLLYLIDTEAFYPGDRDLLKYNSSKARDTISS